MVGRPREFDRDQALEKALEVFWSKGYEATSVQDLVDHMGINRASLYNTFQDKRTLFSAAVESYCQKMQEDFQGILNRPGSPLKNVRALVRRWGEMALKGCDRGCLVTNTTVELAAHDPAIAKTLSAQLKSLEQAIQRTLDRAVEAGELKAGTPTRALARFLTNTDQGLTVMAKAKMSRAAINDIVQVSLSVLS